VSHSSCINKGGFAHAVYCSFIPAATTTVNDCLVHAGFCFCLIGFKGGEAFTKTIKESTVAIKQFMKNGPE
jgi:hypothetical protein